MMQKVASMLIASVLMIVTTVVTCQNITVLVMLLGGKGILLYKTIPFKLSLAVLYLMMLLCLLHLIVMLNLWIVIRELLLLKLVKGQ